MTRIFIDGAAGTTGLDIKQRLAGRGDITLLELDGERRKDPAARADALATADVAILCLPDDAAREAVALGGATARFIDASTAHRTAPDWVYGFPELEPDRARAIADAARVSNPGCYPTGFLALVRPLVREGLLPAGLPLAVYACSGYSGGGKAMIAQFEEGKATTAFQTYGLGLTHKHVPEMRHHAGLETPPLFAPAVAAVYSGMIVEVPLRLDTLASGDVARLRACLADSYAAAVTIQVADAGESDALGVLPIERCAGSDRMELFVFANEGAGQVRLVAALDNLGKGAGGAAVQNLNLMAGLDPTAGLRL